MSVTITIDRSKLYGVLHEPTAAALCGRFRHPGRSSRLQGFVNAEFE